MKKLTLIFIFLLCGLSFGQEYWRNYNSATSRLPNNTIHAIVIDNQDNKWIATSVGLGKFDGTNWTVYNKSNSGLPHNIVRCLAIDKNGDKWIGTDSGLVKFDGKNWTVYTKSNSSLPDDRIRGVAIDKDGFVWAGTKEGGVVSFDGYNWRNFVDPNPEGLVKYINTVFVDKNNVKWIGTSGGGLGKFDGYNWTFFTKANSYSSCNSFISIVFDSKGVLWAGTYSGGIEMFDGTKYGWASYFPKITRLLEHKWVLGVGIDQSGAKWVGTNNIGLWKFEQVNGVDTWSAYDSLNSPLKDTCIVSIAVDKYNNKWIGTYTKGLYIYNENGIVIKNLGVTEPNAGAKWATGTKQKVAWYSTNAGGSVNIKLSLDGGLTYPLTLASGIPNDGSEDITVPDNPSDKCRIKVESASDTGLYGVSQADFRIIRLMAPVLLSPETGASVDPSKLALKWRKAELADGYSVKVANDTGFTVLLVNNASVTDTVLQLSNLSTNMKCYWKVQARITGGTGPWSEVRNFTVLPLPLIPVLQSPENNAADVKTDTLFSWKSAQNASSYRLNISESDQFSTMFFSDSTITATSKEVKGLKNGIRYYWQVKGTNAAGTGPYSAVWNFTTKLNSPESLKAESEIVKSNRVRLTWKDSNNGEQGFIIERRFGGDYTQLAVLTQNQTSYTDTTLGAEGEYIYRVKAYTKDAQSGYSNTVIVKLTGVKEHKKAPLSFALEQNYPNPFNPSTKIKYYIPKESHVSLKVFNLLGSEVAIIVEGRMAAGEHEAVFDGSSLPSGMYLYRLEAAGNVSTKKFVLLK
ncbi:MAG TPA: two-component regulator propeller domain-containing protein [Ignavibacteriales bacterium]|nr:two-component regulator propeller domain-containing protein [Ignavibacteriales bacterium]